MTAALVSVCLGLVTACGAVTWLALRVANLSKALASSVASQTFEKARAEYLYADHKDFKERANRQMQALEDDVVQLESDLLQCTTPDAVRARIDRLLQKTERRVLTDSDTTPTLRIRGAANSSRD